MGRLIRRRDGLTGGSLGIDEAAKKRAKAATTLAQLSQLRNKDRGGYLWGHSLVFLVLGPPLTLPVGFAFYQPAPALRAWDKQERA